MTIIPHLFFADAVFRCQITGKICYDGNCQDCLIAAYFASIDYDKFRRIIEELE